MAASPQTEYTIEDLVAAKAKKTVMVAIHGNVYDLTDFLLDHPGGPSVLEEVSGTNASSAFDDIGHSEDAKEEMQKYLKGVLVSKKKDFIQDDTTNKSTASESNCSIS